MGGPALNTGSRISISVFAAASTKSLTRKFTSLITDKVADKVADEVVDEVIKVVDKVCDIALTFYCTTLSSNYYVYKTT